MVRNNKQNHIHYTPVTLLCVIVIDNKVLKILLYKLLIKCNYMLISTFYTTIKLQIACY